MLRTPWGVRNSLTLARRSRSSASLATLSCCCATRAGARAPLVPSDRAARVRLCRQARMWLVYRALSSAI